MAATDVTATDVTAIRALAHPLRLRLLDLLRVEGPSTATILARRTDESTGSTSYHLRQLARHRFIEAAPPRGSRRERWWRHVDRRVTLEGGDVVNSRQLLRELFARESNALDQFLAEPSRASDWDRGAFFESRIYLLTPSELEQLQDDFHELVKPLRANFSSSAPEEAKPVRLLAFAFPTAADR
jgi:DNA-binding transcriptional ArsR family regulator